MSLKSLFSYIELVGEWLIFPIMLKKTALEGESAGNRRAFTGRLAKSDSPNPVGTSCFLQSV